MKLLKKISINKNDEVQSDLINEFNLKSEIIKTRFFITYRIKLHKVTVNLGNLIKQLKNRYHNYQITYNGNDYIEMTISLKNPNSYIHSPKTDLFALGETVYGIERYEMDLGNVLLFGQGKTDLLNKLFSQKINDTIYYLTDNPRDYSVTLNRKIVKLSNFEKIYNELLTLYIERSTMETYQKYNSTYLIIDNLFDKLDEKSKKSLIEMNNKFKKYNIYIWVLTKDKNQIELLTDKLNIDNIFYLNTGYNSIYFNRDDEYLLIKPDKTYIRLVGK